MFDAVYESAPSAAASRHRSASSMGPLGVGRDGRRRPPDHVGRVGPMKKLLIIVALIALAAVAAKKVRTV